MSMTSVKASRQKSKHKVQARRNQRPETAIDLTHLEFFRHGYALLPDHSDRYPAIAYSIEARNGYAGQRFCTCNGTGSKTCDHLKALSGSIHAIQKQLHCDDVAEVFRGSFWHRLATVLSDSCRDTPETIRFMTTGQSQSGGLAIADRTDQIIVVYRSNGADQSRLIERCTLSDDKPLKPTRADILRRLAHMTMTENEEILQDKGLKSVRQAFEGKFWYRFAYHCFKEFGMNGCVLSPGIDEKSGDFFLNGTDDGGESIFYIPVPRKKVKRLLADLKDALSNQHGLNVEPLSLDSIFDVKLNEGMELEIQPLLRFIQKNGEHRFFKREDLKTFQYGDLYYIKELGILVEDRYPAPAPEFVEPVRTVIQRSRIPQFLSDHAAELQQAYFVIDEPVKQMKIMTGYDHIEIFPHAVERDWCWLSVDYGDGNQSVSLADIILAKQAKQRFIASGQGWVDCDAPDFQPLHELAEHVGSDFQYDQHKGLRLTRTDLFRLQALSGRPLSFTGDSDRSATIKYILELKPSADLPALKGMASSLRNYQHVGVQWLWFLFENRFGGLLCDDMGLGKTHQIMAFLMAIKETRKKDRPFLIICPTSVISHWERKIKAHAPGITAAVYYGIQRDLRQALNETDALITSYGIMRRDIKVLLSIPFAVAVFDEIQHIKNEDTQAYRAADSLQAEMKIGVTGTPIENRLDEIKSLLDLCVPGYLGSKEAFDCNYRHPIEQNNDAIRKKMLGRLIAPFTLRRLKKSVLHELPEKIEDFCFCRLSEDQVKLYRDVLEKRGRELKLKLIRADATVPYMHIFALLNLLKQICNHPAQVEKDPEGYEKYTSGKWELFTELLSECLDSEQKIVVYSQYVGMIDIITRYLADQNVGYVALTGSSRNRGKIIQRFEKDTDCRVFVGSLKAGGVGIDLVAASVVIHYDRWWNAAREDQATDRVHRIGQKRGVQVFKLVTEGTLEEKISAIIARKKDLMESIVKEDDPSLVKTFSRDELLEMLAIPANV